MIVLGLTGSIGMGKSATLALFAEMGAAIYDADASVHALYAKGGAAVAPVGAAFSGVVKDGAIDREALSAHVLGDDQKLRHLEAIVHPLTSASRAAFFETARSANVKIALLDVPLLYETGGDQSVDAVVVCSAPFAVQKERALKRPSMTRQKFKAIVAKQIPDSAKRAKADYVVDTSRGLDDARAQVAAILNDVKSPAWRSRAKQANNPA